MERETPRPIDVGSTVLGRYEVVERLGAGGFGVVWRAVDLVLGREVALKHVPVARPDDDAAARADRRERTVREGRALARLSHPRVVAIHDMVAAGDEPVWLVLEYVAGDSLGALLAREGRWEPGRVARLGVALAAALAHGHERGLVHRDVKPANVLVGDDGAVKLADFGIARLLDDERLTASHQRFGSLAWASPEWARGEEVTAASDVFSLGATLFHAVEGHPPRASGDPAAPPILEVAAGRVATPRHAGPLAAVLTSMLDPDPAARPDATAAARRLELAAADAEVTGGAASGDATDQPAADRPADPGVPARRVAGRRIVLGGALVAVLAVAALLAVVLRPTSPDGPDPEDLLALPPSLAVVSADGDARDVDPCGLVDPGPLSAFGTVTPVPGYYFSACTWRITRPGSDADLRVVADLYGGAGVGGTVRSRTPLGPGGVLSRLAEDDGCRSVLTVTSANRSVALTARSKDPEVDACRLLDAATALTVRGLNEHGFVVRPGRTAGWPLAQVDACSLATRDSLARTGLAPDQVGGPSSSGWGQWDCRWGVERDGTPRVTLSMRLESDADARSGGRTGIADGRTVVSETGEGDQNPRRCTVDLIWRPVAEPAGFVQLLEARVDAGLPDAALCDGARAMVVGAADLLDRPR